MSKPTDNNSLNFASAPLMLKGTTTIDRENFSIKNALILQKGKTKDGRFDISEANLSNFKKVALAANSLKTHLAHKEMFSPVLRELTYLGEIKNLSSSGGKILGDISFSKAAINLDGGKTVNFVLDRLEEDEQEFGLSITSLAEHKWLNQEKDTNPMMEITKFISVTGADFVEFPAATTTINFSSNSHVDDDNIDNDNNINTNDNTSSTEDVTLQGKEKTMDHEAIAKFAAELDLSVKDLNLFKEGCTTTEEVKAKIKLHYENLIETKEILELKKKAMGGSEPPKKEDNKDENVDLQSGTLTGKLNLKVTADETDKLNKILELSTLVQNKVINDPKSAQEVNAAGMGRMTLSSIFKKQLHLNGSYDLLAGNPEDLFEEVSKVNFGGQWAAGTDQFINVCSNILNKSAEIGYTLAETTFEKWVGNISFSDFKTNDMVSMTEFSDFDTLLPGQAAEYGAMTDSKEQGRLKTVGKKFALSRQAFINDDMSMLTNIPQKMMASLKRKQNREAYTFMYGLSFAGPALLTPDSKTMFSSAAAQGNLVALGSGGAPTQTTMDTAYLHFRRLKAESPESGINDIFLYARPKFAILSPEYETSFYALTQSIFFNQKDATLNQGSEYKNIYGPSGSRAVQPIIEPLLETLDSTYTKPWYLVGDQSITPTISMATLKGNNTPYSISGAMPATDARGLFWLVEFDYNFVGHGWKGLYCNPGA